MADADWTDKRARQHYITVTDTSQHSDYRFEALNRLGQLANEGSSDAIWALGAISRNTELHSDYRKKAQKLI